jgi:hypothetical protein
MWKEERRRRRKKEKFVMFFIFKVKMREIVGWWWWRVMKIFIFNGYFDGAEIICLISSHIIKRHLLTNTRFKFFNIR